MVAKLRGYQKRCSKDGPMETFPDEFTVVERVIAQRTQRGEPQYLVKWLKLGYAESTWEPAVALRSAEDKAELKRFKRFNAARPAGAAPPKARASGSSADIPPPEFKNGMMLRDYQARHARALAARDIPLPLRREGTDACAVFLSSKAASQLPHRIFGVYPQVESFRWMIKNFRAHRNVILGDEMGLGKTAQSVAVIEQVRAHEGTGRARLPALIIVPLTTVGHWRREVERWTDMNVVVFTGSEDDRRVCIDNEFRLPGANSKQRPKFDALITTYEIVRDAGTALRGIDWGVVVADEAHKLKNPQSSTAQAVRARGSRPRPALPACFNCDADEEAPCFLLFLGRVAPPRSSESATFSFLLHYIKRQMHLTLTPLLCTPYPPRTSPMYPRIDPGPQVRLAAPPLGHPHPERPERGAYKRDVASPLRAL